ncbi:MAG TPA: hypothetical protein DEA55_08035 [Rhodospirillaceae bacterium]|nr:hypothetical protein [Rhodospirillaceae bacterium]
MSAGSAILVSIAACIVAAALEGLCAGKNVKSFFTKLRFPPYSAPLWLWSIIGGLYYLIFCFVIYRLLRVASDSALGFIALTLISFMMVVNALTNYLIFRAQDLRLSFIVGAIFPVLDIALFICLVLLDKEAAWALIPYLLYLLYRIYAIWWGYRLWKMNSQVT